MTDDHGWGPPHSHAYGRRLITDFARVELCECGARRVTPLIDTEDDPRIDSQWDERDG